MSKTSNQKALIEQLLSDRDAEFRRAVKAERQLKELSDVKRMQADYEARLETSNQKALIEQLLSDRDAEFRRAVKAERQLKELSDVKRMQADYEARLAEKDYEARLAEKEKAIQERDRALESKESRIAQLEQKLLYLERKMWGARSEKRRIPDDPNQLKLDFDLLEMTPEEEETVRKAVEEVNEYRKVTVKEHEKRVPGDGQGT